MTINTQGMSYGDGGSGKSIEEQRDAIPPLKVNKLNLISDALKVESVSYTHLTLPTMELV